MAMIANRAAKLRHDWPSGNTSTTRVRRRISFMIRSSGFLGRDLLPVDVGKGVVGERFGHAPLDKIGRRVRPGGAQAVDDRSCLAVGRFLASPGHGWP